MKPVSELKLAHRGRRGIALLNVLMLAMVSTIFLLAASRFVTDSLKEGRKASNDQQVYNVAKAGISEALSWLRKQSDKPVMHFDPIDDPANPGVNTIDEQIGLVKEWEIDSKRHLWARFEVGRDIGAAPRGTVTLAGARNNTVYPLATDPKNYVGGALTGGLDWACQDISRQRGRSTAGTVWLIRCRAYTFQRPGSTATPAFSLSNTSLRPLQRIEVEAEVVMTEFHPRQAALYCFNDSADATQIVGHGAQCSATGGHVSIHGATATDQVDVSVTDGVGYNVWANSGQVNTTAAANNEAGAAMFGPSVTGMNVATYAHYVNPSLGSQLKDVFNVSDLPTLRGQADDMFDSTSFPPTTFPQMRMVYIDATGMPSSEVVFDGTAGSTNLRGAGVLVVNGNLTLDGRTNAQSWDGLVFCTGNYHQFAGTSVTGGVIAGKHVIIHGASGTGKDTHVRYSRRTLEEVCRQVANYQEQRTTLTIVPGTSLTTY